MNVSHCRKQHERLLWVPERPNEFPAAVRADVPYWPGSAFRQPEGRRPKLGQGAAIRHDNGGLFRVRRREPHARAASVGQSRLHSARLCPRIRGTALAGDRFAAFDREEVTRRVVRTGSRHPLRTWLPLLAVAWGCASWPTFGRPAIHQVLIGGRGIRTADALSAAR